MNRKLGIAHPLAGKLVKLACTVAASSIGTMVHAQVAPMGKGADITPMCGTKPTIVGLVDGFGGGTWHKTALGELKDESSKCKNITKVLYANANGDQQKFNSDINSLVAQGVNVMLVMPDFGPATLPAMRAATNAGVVVVPYNSNPGGVPGKDYAARVYHDAHAMTGLWTAWLGTHLKKGTLLYFGGPAGNAWVGDVMTSLTENLKSTPGIKLLQDQPIATNWNPVDAQKAAAGVIAKYPNVDALVVDYGVTALAVIKAYEQAGVKVPTIGVLASNNELDCKYLKAKASGKAWPYLSLDGTTTQVRFALRRGMSIYQGTKDPEPLTLRPTVFADSFTGIDPKCNPAAPPDADMSSLLTDSQLQAVFK